MKDTKRGLSPQQRNLKLLFSNKAPSAYFPQLNIIFGYQIGLLLNQLAYWEGKQSSADRWIWKTEAQLLKETGLTSSNQKYAINHAQELGILEMAYRQVPRRRHYRVIWEEVYRIAEIRAPKHGLVLTKTILELVGNRPTITKNTQMNSPKTKLSVEKAGKGLNESYIYELEKRKAAQNED